MRTLKEKLGPEWFEVLNPLFDTPEMRKLATRLSQETQVEPVPQDWFRAFEYCQPSQIKVVIIGQDPYYNGNAHGLAFSSMKTIPSSLQIIFNELYQEYGIARKQADLTDWAKQGVLLFNTILTTKHGEPLAHANWGWEVFAKAVSMHIASLSQPYVVMAWGKYAKSVTYNYLLDAPEILDACHPQAEVRNPGLKFTGCGHFKKANEFLIINNIKPIAWV